MTSTPQVRPDIPTAGAADNSNSGELKGAMTTFDIVFTVLAFNAPLAVFAGYLTVIIGYANGLGAPLTLLAAGLVVLVFAVGFTAMSRHLPNPGAFYAYITAGLGRPMGLGAAFLALICYVFLYVSSLIYAANSISSLVQQVFKGPLIDWWIYNVILIAVVGVLGFFRITLSARILTVAMCLEVVIIVLYNAVVFAQGGSEGYTSAPLQLHYILGGSVGLAVLYCIGMFSGFEATAIFREEARNPEKTIPRATYIVIAVVAVLYSVTSFAIIIGIGPSSVVDATATDPVGSVLSSIDHYLGKTALDITQVLLCTSIFAAVLAMHNIIARYLFSMGRDRVFPRKLAAVHPTHGSPHIASFATSVIAVVFLIAVLVIGADGNALYAKLAGIALYALIVLLLLTSVSIPLYFRKHADHGIGAWKTTVAPLLSGVGFAVALVLATKNAAFLVGGSQTAANLLIAVFIAALLLGIGYALVLRKQRPDTYARIGRQEVA
ncbi:APC family permease [Nocardia sp. NBC_00565]|uniref:APC family permease n=1 Tax=Nocardia sp. NBC_00565 TaxID=2975993 RepID=UPI002E8122B2|nr:APC family permease [Nocardia sp. NBC_00565]WUC06360.1 APC family permease [Nocardia sp. NBC_00565]